MEETGKHAAITEENSLLDSNSLWLRDCLSRRWSLYTFSLWILWLLFWTSIFFWHPKHSVARNTRNLTLRCMTNHVQLFWIWCLLF